MKTVYENWTFDINSIPMPEPFNVLAKEELIVKNMFSKFTTDENYKGHGTSKTCRAHVATAVSIMNYARLVKGVKNAGDALSIGTFETTSGQRYIASASYLDTNDGSTITEVAIWNPNAADDESAFKVGVLDDGKLKKAHYGQNNHNILGISMFAAMIPEILKEEEANEIFVALQKLDLSDTNPAKIQHSYSVVALYCDNVYRRVLGQAGEFNLNGKIGNTTELEQIVETALKNYDIKMIAGNEFDFDESKAKSNSEENVSDFTALKALYGDPDEKWNEKERAMIPSIDNINVSKEVIEAVKLFRNAEKLGISQNNLAFMGEAGSGKSTDAMAIAAVLNKPFLVLSISSNTDESNIKAGIYPVFSVQDENGKLQDGFESRGKKWSQVTSLEEINISPEDAYEKLTGKRIEGVSPSDVMEWILQNGADKEENKYVYMLSPLVEALTKGYVVEVQEVNLCNDPAVMPVINEFLERGTIRMDNGQVLKRDPSSIAIFTMNIDYAGCNQMNASVMSRIHWKVVKNTPPAREMVNRLCAEINITNFTDEARNEALKMAKVVIEINDYCKTKGFNDGSCGYREFKNWFLATQILGVNPHTAAKNTIIPTATLDLDAQEELITSVLEKYYNDDKIYSTRKKRNK